MPFSTSAHVLSAEHLNNAKGENPHFSDMTFKIEVTEIARVALNKILLTCGSRSGSKRARNHFSKT